MAQAGKLGKQILGTIAVGATAVFGQGCSSTGQGPTRALKKESPKVKVNGDLNYYNLENGSEVPAKNNAAQNKTTGLQPEEEAAQKRKATNFDPTIRPENGDNGNNNGPKPLLIPSEHKAKVSNKTVSLLEKKKDLRIKLTNDTRLRRGNKYMFHKNDNTQSFAGQVQSQFLITKGKDAGLTIILMDAEGETRKINVQGNWSYTPMQ